MSNNTYKGLRLIGEDYSISYSVWCTGDREYYNVRLDPGQMENYFDGDAAKLRENYENPGARLLAYINELTWP